MKLIEYKRYVIIIFSLIAFSTCFSQRSIQTVSGARSLSLGSMKAVLDKQDGIIHNFSNITNENKFSVVLGSERRFELEELSSALIGVHFPMDHIGHFAINFSTYGFSAFKESKISVAYARKLSDVLSISGNFDVNTIRIEDFGSKNSFSFGIGMSGQFDESLKYGLYIFNPEKIEIAPNTEAQSFIQFGLSKQFLPSLTVYAEVEKIIVEELNLKLAVEYSISNMFVLRTGFNTSPGSFSFGLAYSLNNLIIIEGAAQYNTILGITPGVGLKYTKF